MLTLGSLFDGIGGWCLGAQRAGIKPVWSAEIDHKTCSDSARYKALGNGMAQNVPDWILKRLVAEVEKEGTK